MKKAFWRSNRSPGLSIRAAASLVAGQTPALIPSRWEGDGRELHHPPRTAGAETCPLPLRPHNDPVRVPMGGFRLVAMSTAGDDHGFQTALLKSLQTSLPVRWFPCCAKLNELSCFITIIISMIADQLFCC